MFVSLPHYPPSLPSPPQKKTRKKIKDHKLGLLRGMTPFFTLYTQFLRYAKLSQWLYNRVLLILFLSVSLILLPQVGWNKHFSLWRTSKQIMSLVSYGVLLAVSPAHTESHLVFGVHPIYPQQWEVLPEANRLLFVPQWSWGSVRLCFFLPSLPLLFPSFNLKAKLVGLGGIPKSNPSPNIP